MTAPTAHTWTGGRAVATGAASADGSFEAGALCLDFLAAPPDLTGWAAAALGLEQVLPMTLQQERDAETLRVALIRIALALVEDADPPIGDVARLNRLAGDPDLPPQIGAGRTQVWPTSVSVGQVVATVARDAVHLLTSEASGRIKTCAADDCERIFLDASAPGQRRWCSMATCGNRAKVRAYRRRQAERQRG